ncbi:hypothetical protein [Vibrio penaeicida]|uniref:hypothetical protein n=1 Tax=Vibrio penaeicida TaxID=104609 RepID=UPI000F82E841|nr:hypothetical protein [Vibrio penaeicida]RTZ23877.1 hypothetical protein EKN09_06620 [Vibrio penaeicida]
MDFGRANGIDALLADEFNCLGRYSDADKNNCIAIRFLGRNKSTLLTGAFKTPSLRGVALTPPYFHHGKAENLFAVINHYNDNDNSLGAMSVHELTDINLSDEEVKKLVAFLKSLSPFVN